MEDNAEFSENDEDNEDIPSVERIPSVASALSHLRLGDKQAEKPFNLVYSTSVDVEVIFYM